MREEIDRNPLDVMAEEYVHRHRSGERPQLDEFVRRRPELEDPIRRLLPAALLLANLRPTQDDLSSGADALAADDHAPARLGDFRIVREIGRGGMGVVYEAEQESLGRRVALKLLSRTRGLSDSTLQRFGLEAKAAARLHHSNIVPVFGVGEDEGVPFYVMQYIDGQGLDSVLRELRRLRRPNVEPADASSSTTALSQSGSSYWRTIATLGADVAGALQYAHDAGILHRDVKPSNLLLDTRGTIWVTDFGLAKLHDQPDVTRDDDVIGTVRYMAPERFEGRCDARCDVYSLGLVLYELLTLRQAHAATQRQRLVRQITHEEPPRPRSIDRMIPRDLETIVLKAIARDARDRYGSAGGLAEDLRRFVEDRPVFARRIGGVERLGRWCRRNPLLAGLVLTSAALLVTLAAGSLFVAARFGRWAEQERIARGDAERTLSRLYHNDGLSAAERNDNAVAALYFAHAASLAPPQNPQRRLDLMRAHTWGSAAVTPLAAFRCDVTGDDAQIKFEGGGRYVVVRGGAEGRRIAWDLRERHEVGTPDAQSIATSADGADGRTRVLTPEVLVAVENEKIVWRDRSTGRELRSQSLNQAPAWLCSDARRRVLAVAVGSQIRLFEVATGSPLKTLDVHPDLAHCGALSGDGSLLLLAGRAKSPVLWSVKSGSPTGPSLTAIAGASAVALSEDGRRIATLNEGIVSVWSQPADVFPRRRIELSAPYASVRIDPTGRFVLPSGMGTTNDALRSTRVYDIATGEPAGPELAVDGVMHGAEFSPDGRSIAVICSGKAHELRLWPDHHSDTPPVVRPLSAMPVAMAFSPQSERICVFCADGKVSCMRTAGLEVAHSWSTTPPQLDQALIRHGGVRFSPDGKSIVTWGGPTVDVRDAETGEPRYPPLKHEDRCFDVDFTPDARFLATAGYDRTARVCDAATGRPAVAPMVHAAPVYRVRMAAGGSRLVTNCLDGAVHVWDWQSQRAAAEVQGSKYAFVTSPSPDGRWLLTGCDGESLRIVEVGTGEPVAPPLRVSGTPWTVELSADGEHVAVAGSAAAIDTFDLWALGAAPDSAATAIRQAELTSGFRLDGGALRRLSPEEWFDRWGR